MYPTENYLGAFSFRVFIEGLNDPLDGFTKVSVVNSYSELVEWRHGMDVNIRKAPGRNNADDIVLTRVYQGTDEFSSWRERISLGAVEPRTMMIEMRRSNGAVVRSMQLVDAWPIRWSMPQMDGSGGQMATEEITLTYGALMLV